MSNSFSLTAIFSRLTLGCVLAAVLIVSGCGEANPLVELRDLGADFKRTKSRTVELVRMPKETGDEELKLVAAIDNAKTITMLDLSGTQVTDEGLESLEPLAGLETLDLTGTAITDEGLKYLEGLKNLRDLRIGDTEVTADGLKKLVPELTSLAVLDVEGAGAPEEPEERTWKSALNFGIDLAGGTNLVYQVDQAQLLKKQEDFQEENPDAPDSTTRVTDEVMDQMVAAVSRRLNPSGVEEITVRRVGADRIEIIIPRASEEVIARKKAQMTRLGSLEFALLANQREHGDIYEQMRNREQDLLREDDNSLLASWRPVGVNANGTPKEVGGGGEVYTRNITIDGVDVPHFLVVFGREKNRVTGEYLSRAYETTDENGRLAVGFLFNTQGGFRFGNLTRENKPKADGFQSRLAILLDNKIHSAPSIITTITNQGQITGSFSQEEIQDLVGVLNAGALTVPIQEKPISELTVSPTLGVEVQEKGKNAILIAAGVVLVFMLVYYLFAGLVADLCLVLNIILVMGTMALIDATFTLPGLAGIVLTIGMAVDANVLIFERIREELNRGSSMRLSIQNGFGKALSAIVDANLTTLITAVVLYTIGTDQVRGFAVTLFIGIVMSMFTALYAGRLVFDICERKRWVTKLSMLSIVSSNPGLKFISKWKLAAVVSVAVIIGGMSTFFARGSDNFDIDFSGGTMLTFMLIGEEDKDIEDVRSALEAEFTDESITLERLTRENADSESATPGQLFRIRSKEQDADLVAQKVAKAIDNKAQEEKGWELERIEMTPKPDQIEANIEKITLTDEDRSTNLADYENGLRVPVTFEKPLTQDYIQQRFTTELESLTEEGEPKYPRARANRLVLVDLPKSESLTDDTAQRWDIVVKEDVEMADFKRALVGMQGPRFDGKSSFDSSVAGEMKWSAVQAILVSLIAIVAYIWFRFQRITFGLAAVVAVVHDVLAVLGIVALVSYGASNMGFTFLGLEDFKINLPMIAAFLTIVGYSLNDTIVVFDRIREVRGKNPALTEQMIDTSLNQTLSRTLLTSLTTWFVVGILYFIGGEGIHGFAFCLVMGVIVGTYSSIFVASPVLLWLMNREGTSRSTSVQKPAKAASAD